MPTTGFRMHCERKRLVLLPVVVLVVALIASTAHAALTPILPGPEIPLAEAGGILDTLYGLSNLTRIDENFDQLWVLTDSIATVTVVAKFSAFTQDFGFITDSTFLSILPAPPLVGASNTFMTTEIFQFGDNPNGALGPPLWSSQQSDNLDGGRDHMVTWQITGNTGFPGNTIGNFVLAWEDLFDLGDRDYNDLVVEVGGVTPASPEPGTLLLIGSGLVGMGVGARRRK